MTTCIAYVGNTNLVELIGLKDAITGDFILDAAVTVIVKDAHGDEIDGQTWPTAMAFVEASDGDYRAVIEHDAALVAGEECTAVIEVNDGTERIGHWEFAFTPKVRRGT